MLIHQSKVNPGKQIVLVLNPFQWTFWRQTVAVHGKTILVGWCFGPIEFQTWKI